MKTLCVIPARYASSRLPGKPLIEIEGRTLVQHVCDRVTQVPYFTDVVVATDDKRIFDHVKEAGYEVLMTRDDHSSGTERLIEVANRLDHYDIYVNVQGDEPLISTELLTSLSVEMQKKEGAVVYTASSPITINEIENPNVVKVVTDLSHKAMLFSRAPIPFAREGQWISDHHQKHVGVYYFSREAMEKIQKLQPHPFEKYESLEQLRWLLNGIPIYVYPSDYQSIGVDTPEDIQKVSELIRNVQ